jgi:hypothetical protein
VYFPLVFFPQLQFGEIRVGPEIADEAVLVGRVVSIELILLVDETKPTDEDTTLPWEQDRS